MKLLVLGLDGATFRIIKPLVRKNKLPTFKKLFENGCHGILQSTIPPLTVPAWPSMITGKTPKKLNLFGFFKTLKKSKIASFEDLKNTIFDLLSKKIKIGALNVPCTYPPRKVNGFIVSGMLTPSSKINKCSYPPKLILKLKKKFEYEIHADWGEAFTKEHQLKSAYEILERRIRAIFWLTKKFKIDFLFVVLRITDIIQHQFFTDKAEIERVYKKIDSIIKELVEKINPDNIFIVSDHGFYEVKMLFNIYKWLEENGFIKTKITLKHKFYKFINKTLPLFPQLRRKILEKTPLSLKRKLRPQELTIDFESAICYPSPTGKLFGSIYTDSLPKTKKDHVIKLLCKKLLKIKTPYNQRLIKRIIRFENHNSSVPNIIFEVKKPYCITIHSKELWEKTSTGEHDLERIFIAYGKDIVSNQKIRNAKIYDIAPTVLHMFGLPIPKDMDGKVLKEIFKPNSEIAKRKVRYVDPSYYRVVKRRKVRTSKKDEELIKERLRALGYI